jgi:hypothetical protein
MQILIRIGLRVVEERKLNVENLKRKGNLKRNIDVR